ncbi:MAG: alpha/beta hydrolase [Rhodoglobus sp.]
MTQFEGLDPDRARTLSSALSTQIEALGAVTVDVERTVSASFNPFTYGFDPGQWIIAPFSIAFGELAHRDLARATENARTLISRLQREITAQELSSAGGSRSEMLIATGVRATATELAESGLAARAAWWASLSRAERTTLIHSDPALIGNLEGIPYSDRDRANRVRLKLMLADDTISDRDRDALQAVKNSLDVGHGVTKQLIILDFPTGADPRAAIAFGDLDDADFVGVVIPGRDNTVGKDMANLASASLNLYKEQEAALVLRGGTSGNNVSVVAWMGYQTPGGGANTAVFSDDRAIAGGAHLSNTLGGLDAAHTASNQDSRVTVFAHSYGTRAAASSLSGQASADSFVMFGSAGLESSITDASDLNVPDGQVYATESDDDSTADIGRGLPWDRRLDPYTDSGFGSSRFGSDGTDTYFGTDGHSLLLSDNSDGKENGYMDEGTESLHNMALIGIGDGHRTTGSMQCKE